jgi:hypothetical protein
VDNCPAVANTMQENSDNDATGDACDPCPNDVGDDIDGDGSCGDVDRCPLDSKNTCDDDDTVVSGCGCRLVGDERDTSPSGWPLLLLGAAAWARRRRSLRRRA